MQRWRLGAATLLGCAALLTGQESNDRSPPTVWEHLLAKYDADGDGEITAAEHNRGPRQFQNLDRNGDGTLTAADFGRGTGRGRGRGRGRGGRRSRDQRAALLRAVGDTFASFLNVDGQPGLSQRDWQAMVDRLTPEGKAFDPRDLTPILGRDGKTKMARLAGDGLARALDLDGDGTASPKELDRAFTLLDQDGSGTVEQGKEIDMPPPLGSPAPDFTLPLVAGGEGEVTLSSFRGKQPVALIFGSYT